MGAGPCVYFVDILWVVLLFLLAEYCQPVSILSSPEGQCKYYGNILIFTRALRSGSKFTQEKSENNLGWM